MSCLHSNAVQRYRERRSRRGEYFWCRNASLPFDFCEHFVFPTLYLIFIDYYYNRLFVKKKSRENVGGTLKIKNNKPFFF